MTWRIDLLSAASDDDDAVYLSRDDETVLTVRRDQSGAMVVVVSRSKRDEVIPLAMVADTIREAETWLCDASKPD